MTPGNWLSGTMPAATDLLVFDGNNVTATNDFPATTSLSGITFNATAGAFTLSGNSITLSGTIIDSATTAQTITLPIALGATPTVTVGTGGTLTINGDGTTSSGNRSTLKVTAAGTNGGPSSTFNFSLYPVNASTMFVVSTDTDQSTGGAFTKQITPP
jgi:hypothetical protein